MSEIQQNKQLVAQKAIKYIDDKYNNDIVIGVGSGSTVNCFIEQINSIKHKCKAFVSSSKQTTELLKSQGINVDNSQLMFIDVYVDGADQVNENLYMLKGGGAALTGEKILAVNSSEFICIVDDTKIVQNFSYPVVVECIPLARGYVAKKLIALGGQPVWREGCATDNGNHILDVHHLPMSHLIQLELEINKITGVVENGIFANRTANVLLKP
jgi:ribose 5-phosphate isomerase A